MLQMVEVSSNGIGQKSWSVFEIGEFDGKIKGGLSANVPKHRGKQESHHHHKSSYKRQESERGSGLGAGDRVRFATHIVINKGGSRGRVGH